MGEARRRREHCAYCGEPATSMDHVPPRSLFSIDRLNLIRVPACDTHNGKRSGLDERFREFISLYVGAETPRTQSLWETTVRGLKRNRSRLDDLLRTMRYLPDLNRYALAADGSAFVPVVKQIVRGLYWHCYKERLPSDVDIEANLMQVGDWLLEASQGMTSHSVGDGQFFFFHLRMEAHPTISVWILIFHRQMVAMALTDMALADRIDRQTGHLRN